MGLSVTHCIIEYSVLYFCASFHIACLMLLYTQSDITWLEEALMFTEDEVANLTDIHLPWGVPQLLDDTDYDASLLLLYHHTHVTGTVHTFMASSCVASLISCTRSGWQILCGECTYTSQ